MKLFEQLLPILFDKLAIGLIILLVGLGINKKLEKFKSELNRITKEYEIRFSKLHENRANILSKFYKMIEAQKRSVEVFTKIILPKNGIEGHGEEAKRIFSNIAKIAAFFDEHELYFEKELAARIKKILDSIQEPVYHYYIFKDNTENLNKYLPDVIEKWTRELPNINNTLSDIADEFRVILGSEKVSPNATKD